MIDKGALSRVIFLAMLFSSPTTVSPQESSPGSRWLQDASGCKFLDLEMRYPAEVITWSGICVDGFVDGRGEVTLSLRRWTFSGVFRQGQIIEGKNVRTNGTYEGEFKSNLPDGRGTLALNDGRVISGDFVNGRPGGKVSIRYLTGARYEGEVVNNLVPSGQGKLFFAGGGVYEGSFVEGKPQGYGKSVSANGDRYEGEFVQNFFHGKGALHYSNGATYEGEFVSGMRHGRGKLRYADGGTYEGSFLQNARHGTGRYQRSNGDVLEGEWAHDGLHGKGVERLASGVTYEGDFVAGKRQGRGKWNDNTRGWTYEGQFLDGLFHGTGKLQSKDGYEYSGEFLSGLAQGQGIERTRNGEFYEGGFVRGGREGHGVLRGQMRGQDYIFDGTFVSGAPKGPGVLKIAGVIVEGEFGPDGLRKARITAKDGLQFEIDRDAGTAIKINPDGSRTPVTEKDLPEGVI